jgi:hypothetical protein
VLPLIGALVIILAVIATVTFLIYRKRRGYTRHSEDESSSLIEKPKGIHNKQKRDQDEDDPLLQLMATMKRLQEENNMLLKLQEANKKLQDMQQESKELQLLREENRAMKKLQVENALLKSSLESKDAKECMGVVSRSYWRFINLQYNLQRKRMDIQECQTVLNVHPLALEIVLKL